MDKFAIELPRFVIALSLVLAVLALAALLCGLVLLRRAAAPSVDGETDISSVYDSLHGAESRLKTAELARGLMGLVCSGVVLFWMVEGLKLVNILALLIPGTLFVAVAAGIYLPWLASRERRIREQRSAALRRLEELKRQMT